MNSYLTQDMYSILNELNHSHSGELMHEKKAGWWIDNHFITNTKAIEDLYRLRLIKLVFYEKIKETWKITEDGLGCISNIDYIPVIARKN